MEKSYKIVAHRGTTIEHLENSIESFIYAGENNYFASECDIHLTKDNILVVHHDERTNRLGDIDVFIKDTNYSALVNINLYSSKYSSTYKIPTYREYLEVCKKYNMKAIVELKAKFDSETIKFVINDSLLYSDSEIIFIAFDLENLLLIRSINKNYKLQLLSTTINDEIINTCKKYNLDIDVDNIILTKKAIEELHKNNILVNTWTVDNDVWARTLIEYGIDMITTNVLPSDF